MRYFRSVACSMVGATYLGLALVFCSLGCSKTSIIDERDREHERVSNLRDEVRDLKRELAGYKKQYSPSEAELVMAKKLWIAEKKSIMPPSVNVGDYVTIQMIFTKGLVVGKKDKFFEVRYLDGRFYVAPFLESEICAAKITKSHYDIETKQVRTFEYYEAYMNDSQAMNFEAGFRDLSLVTEDAKKKR